MQSRGRRVRAAIGLVPLLTGGPAQKALCPKGVSLDEGHRLSSELESVLVLQSLMAPFVGLVGVAAVPFAEHDLARLDVAAKSIALRVRLASIWFWLFFGSPIKKLILHGGAEVSDVGESGRAGGIEA